MITIERLDPNDPAGFKELGAFLLPMAGEVSIIPVDPATAAEELWLAVAEGNTFVAKIDGKIAGAIAMISNKYWQNRAFSFLVDMFFYVAKDQRFALVGVKLLRAVKEMAEPGDKAAFVRVINRNRHGKNVQEGLYATIAGFIPFGHLTMIRSQTVPSPVVAAEVPEVLRDTVH